jgi:hypothetical protein
MIREKPAPHLMRGVKRFSLRQTQSVCPEIMPEQANEKAAEAIALRAA